MYINTSSLLCTFLLIFIISPLFVASSATWQLSHIRDTEISVYPSKVIPIRLVYDQNYIRFNISSVFTETVNIYLVQGGSQELLYTVRPGGLTPYIPKPENGTLWVNATTATCSMELSASNTVYSTVSVGVSTDSCLPTISADFKAFTLVFGNTNISPSVVWVQPNSTTYLSLEILSMNVEQTDFVNPFVELAYIKQGDDLSFSYFSLYTNSSATAVFRMSCWYGKTSSPDGFITSGSTVQVYGAFDTRYIYACYFQSIMVDQVGYSFQTYFRPPTSLGMLECSLPTLGFDGSIIFLLDEVLVFVSKEYAEAGVYHDANAPISIFLYSGVPADNEFPNWAWVLIGVAIGVVFVAVGSCYGVIKARRRRLIYRKI